MGYEELKETVLYMAATIAKQEKEIQSLKTDKEMYFKLWEKESQKNAELEASKCVKYVGV